MADLTKAQLEKLKKKLLERQRALIEEVREKREQAATENDAESFGGTGDAGDESVLRMITDLDITEAGRDVEELRDIDAALHRMEDGSYGTCDECGQEIGFPRLEVQPTATRCIADQEKFEKTFATRQTPTL
jgi:RNA polymerase-binding protein DksA